MGHFLRAVVTDSNGDPLENAIGQVFDIQDTNNAAPLQVLTMQGVPFSLDQVPANNDGVTPEMDVPGKKFIKWVSGPYEVGMVAADQIPTGGIPGQLLSKASTEDYDIEWANPLGVAAGGVDGQVLYKDGSVEFATRWGDAPVGGSTGTGSSGLQAGQVGFVRQNADGSWPTRPTSLTSVLVMWVGVTTWPAIVSSGVNGPHVGDIFVEKRIT